ncbi:MAG: T9SS type A sorting domain-containing protein [Bacteroidales bacterium]
MRSICITLLGIFLTVVSYSQISYDTTYSRQWNSAKKSWENFDRIIATYNNGLISSELIQISEGKTWTNYNLKAFYYNNGLVIEEFEQYWNDSKMKWEDNYRKLYSYNTDKKVTQITHQNIFQGNYVNSSRELFIYTKDGQLKEKIVQKYEEAWTNFLRYQYYYNAKNLLMDENLAYWTEDAWDNSSYNYNYEYNTKGNLVEKTKTQVSGSKTKNLVKEEYNYGNNDKLEEHIVSTWNNVRNTWTNKNRAIYANNMNGYVLSMLNQTEKKSEWINYFFTEFSGDQELYTGIDLAGGMSFSVSPKDFGNIACIEFTNPYNELFFVQVLNEQGQLMGSTTTDGKEISIDARNLNKGLYFVELQGSNLYSGKFSIE